MKKQVSAFISLVGGSASYSGRTNTMFITDHKFPIFDGTQSIENAVYNKFGMELPFKVVTN